MLLNGQKPLIAVIMPHRSGEGNIGAGCAFERASKLHTFIKINRGHSLLTFCFNQMLAEVLNLRSKTPITHLAMLHNDVCPEPGWVDVLVDEIEATGADMISAIVPIKDQRGLTSTAVEDASDLWMCRRVTMHEAFQLPETFGAEDLVWHGPQYGRLLLNTGCWVAKLGQWIDTPGPLTGHRPWFRQQDRLVTVGDETFAQAIPEDWDWSRQLQDLGCKLLATRKLSLYHQRQEWHTDKAWGTWRTDLGYLEFKKLEAQKRAEAA